MSGPDYPRADPTSNEIGKFTIDVSPIGDIPAFDVWTTVLSQYANSDILMGLVTSFAAYIDPTKNLADFFDLIWNVDTAEGYGLDTWGRIVGITRTLQVDAGDYFGFAEATDAETFGFGQFYSGQPLTTNYDLADHAYRTLIFAKALANISNNSIQMLNQMLVNLFPHRGNCYVTEGDHSSAAYFGFAESTTAYGFNQAPFYDGETLSHGMKMTYTFEFPLAPFELAIVENSNVLPKPCGVAASVVQIV